MYVETFLQDIVLEHPRRMFRDTGSDYEMVKWTLL